MKIVCGSSGISGQNITIDGASEILASSSSSYPTIVAYGNAQIKDSASVRAKSDESAAISANCELSIDSDGELNFASDAVIAAIAHKLSISNRCKDITFSGKGDVKGIDHGAVACFEQDIKIDLFGTANVDDLQNSINPVTVATASGSEGMLTVFVDEDTLAGTVTSHMPLRVFFHENGGQGSMNPMYVS